MSDHCGTYLTVPSRQGAAAFMLGLNLDVPEPDLTSLGELSSAPALAERVRRVLKRHAFGGSASAFRHGRWHGIGERRQCELWLLALVAWIDVWGWDWALKHLAGAKSSSAGAVNAAERGSRHRGTS